MTIDYKYFIVTAEQRHIFKNTAGEFVMTVLDLDGADVDLTKFDKITCVMKNYPEKDETISLDCTVLSTDSKKCYFSFDKATSAAWLASAYTIQLSFIRYDRDQVLITASTGYVPTYQTLETNAVATTFAEGETVTGAGGATAIVLEADLYDDICSLKLTNVSGAFVDDEAITGDQGGDAVVDGILSDPVDIDENFADDSEDFVTAPVRENDELVIGSNTYVVSGFHEIIVAWIELEEELSETGTGISYVINTWDASSSSVDHEYKSEPCSIYIEEPL
jgi:hypothetical protein